MGRMMAEGVRMAVVEVEKLEQGNTTNEVGVDYLEVVNEGREVGSKKDRCEVADAPVGGSNSSLSAYSEDAESHGRGKRGAVTVGFVGNVDQRGRRSSCSM